MVKHCMELTSSDVRTFNTFPYLDGPKACELENTETKNILQIDVIEPVQSGWASPIVFSARRTAQYASV